MWTERMERQCVRGRAPVETGSIGLCDMEAARVMKRGEDALGNRAPGGCWAGGRSLGHVRVRA